MNVNIENNIPETDEYVADGDLFQRKAIRFKGSDKCVYLNFGDTKFPNRLLTARKEIGEYLESKREELGVDNIDDIKTDSPSVEEIEKTLALEDEIDNFIKEKLDYIFGYEMSKEVFDTLSTIGVTPKGEYYFDNFLNSILPFVEKEYNVRINATNERIKKYTDQKGKHINPYIKR